MEGATACLVSPWTLEAVPQLTVAIIVSDIWSWSVCMLTHWPENGPLTVGKGDTINLDLFPILVLILFPLYPSFTLQEPQFWPTVNSQLPRYAYYRRLDLIKRLFWPNMILLSKWHVSVRVELKYVSATAIRHQVVNCQLTQRYPFSLPTEARFKKGLN
jgi:hypothetical protein